MNERATDELVRGPQPWLIGHDSVVVLLASLLGVVLLVSHQAIFIFVALRVMMIVSPTAHTPPLPTPLHPTADHCGNLFCQVYGIVIWKRSSVPRQWMEYQQRYNERWI